MDDLGTLLEELARLQVTCAVDNGQLTINAARGVVTPELRQRLAANKDAILARLQRRSAAAPSAADAPPIVADPDADGQPFPLSDLQLGFYIANDTAMEFHVRPHCYAELDREDFDPAAYQAAWNKALTRHRREICVVNRDVKLQPVVGDVQVVMQVYDLRDRTPEHVEQALQRVRDEMKRQELPLDSWPWLDLRVSLWRDGGRERARVHYNHNNFFSDGFGSMQLIAEIERYYRDPSLTYPPLELSYRDAVLGLEGLAASAAGVAARDYWFARLPDLPPPPALPQRLGLNRRCRSKLDRREGTLAPAEWDAFKARASALGVTPSNAVLAAYAFVLATWSNSDRFIVNQMVTRRFSELHPDIGRIIGNFASLYPLSIHLVASASFLDNAKRIQAQVLDDMQHLQIGGMRVLGELNRLKGSFGSAPCPFVVGSGLAVKDATRASFTVLETSQTVLDHQFFELADGTYYYMWDLLEEFFPDGLIDDMWEAYHGLLRLLAADREAWLRTRFDLVGDADLAERRRRNDTHVPVPDGCLHDALAAHAARDAGHDVLCMPHASMTYGALATRSDVLADQLRRRGIGRGDLVPIVVDRGPEALIGMVAIVKCGAAYVPLDPRVPANRLALLLEDLGVRLALTSERHRHAVAWPDAVTPVCVSPDPSEPRDEAVSHAAPSDGASAGLAYVIYTSGSTGRPKGVMIEHGPALNTIVDVNRRFGVGPADRLFGVSALTFDLSVYDVFGAIAAGATLVFPDADSGLDPGHWVDLLIGERVTIWNSVPALMQLLVEAAQRRRATFPALRLVMLSGDKIPLDLPDAVRAIAPNAHVVSLGGATEASIWSIFYPIADVDPQWSTVPYGYPMDNQRWHVRDRNGFPCPRWVPGELFIAGVGLARGYWNDPAKTAQSFQTDALTGERLYRTGDVGRYLPGGAIEWMGRTDSQIKLQGLRIELGEIEAGLQAHPSVGDAVVVVDDGGGAQRARLVGYVVPAAGSTCDARQLESSLQRTLPAHMVPTAWRILDRLPLTAHGKVDRAAVAALGAADQPSAGAVHEWVPPATAVEQRLAAIWEQVLGISRVGATDDYFELGGQSFDAIRIFTLIAEEFGRAYTLGDLWRARTVRELAADLEGAAPRGPERIVPIDRRGSGTPVFLVHPAGGTVTSYVRLGRLIDRPLYGIQADASADGTSRRDIVALSAEYVSELRQLQPHGPYTLGGWSTGGMVAFEMAAQLEAAGERVTRLFMLDGPVPVDHGELDGDQLLRWYLEDLALGLPIERLQGERLAGLSAREQLSRAAGLLDATRFGVDLEALAPSFVVFRDLIAAGSRYRPPTIRADVTVVRVEDNVVSEFAAHPNRFDPDWGWQRFTAGDVQCVRVPGSHHTFLTEPNVDHWYAVLADAAPVAEVRQ